MIRGALGVIAAFLLVGAAGAQEAPKTPPPMTAGEPAAPADQPKEITSPLLGTKLLYPGFTLSDDGSYRSSLDAIAALEKSKCGAGLEAYGWTYADLTIGEAIFTATIHDIQNAGFDLKKVGIEQFKNKRVYPFYGVRSGKLVLMLWLVDDDAAQVSLCEIVPKT